MLQEQELQTPTSTQRDTVTQHGQVNRLLRGLLIGGGLTVVVGLLETGFILLFNPFHVLGNGTNRFSALLTLPVHFPIVFLVLLLELLLFSLLAFFAARPVALVRYLYQVHQVQEKYSRLYTPLAALANIRGALDDYARDATPTVSIQEEQVSILDLVQQQDMHQMILGAPGSGKTMALRVYQYSASQQPLNLVLKRNRIPVYVPMKNYSLYLKKMLPIDEELDNALAESQVTLLDFLYESDLLGMRFLRLHLYPLAQQGRLLLLCDGLNEVDSNYL